MNALFNSAKTGLLVYKLAITRGIFYSLNALITTFLAAVLHVNFPALPHWKQFLILLAVIAAWTNTMMAFLDKTISSLSSKTNLNPSTKDPT